jgi:hypothetical protein
LDFVKQYKEGAPDFGTVMSPILDSGLLIAHVGGTKFGALTAFDAATGTVKWPGMAICRRMLRRSWYNWAASAR